MSAAHPKPAAQSDGGWTDAQMIEFASFCVYAVSLKDKSLGERLEVFRDREKVRGSTPPPTQVGSEPAGSLDIVTHAQGSRAMSLTPGMKWTHLPDGKYSVYLATTQAPPVGEKELLAWIEEALSYVGCSAWSPSLLREGKRLLALRGTEGKAT